jgi:hypothetical protein
MLVLGSGLEKWREWQGMLDERLKDRKEMFIASI